MIQAFIEAHPVMLIAALPFIVAPFALWLGPRDHKVVELAVCG